MIPLDKAASTDGVTHEERARRLTEVIDWAESEAAAINVADVGICLQLARLALQSRSGK